jgi:hypothetical protein
VQRVFQKTNDTQESRYAVGVGQALSAFVFRGDGKEVRLQQVTPFPGRHPIQREMDHFSGYWSWKCGTVRCA